MAATKRKFAEMSGHVPAAGTSDVAPAIDEVVVETQPIAAPSTVKHTMRGVAASNRTWKNLERT
jgi:hypothetical protein